MPTCRVAKVGCALGDRLEHRLHVGRRARNDAQDLADRRLLLERLLRLLEQAHVLDRDDGLVGEGLQQLDLLVRETAARPAAADGDRAERPALAQHRHGDDWRGNPAARRSRRFNS